jgi:hypothetical protein
MQDKIIILKNTKNGIVKDTIMSIQDTIQLNLRNLVKLQQPDDKLIVHTISEPMSFVEVLGLWVGIILAIITIVYTFIAIRKLLTNDKQLQSQINELVNLNKLFERRLRMSIKPRIYIDSCGTAGHTREVHFNLKNRGELCYYDGYEFIEGDLVEFTEWPNSVTIEKDARIIITGRCLNKHPTDVVFKIKVFYHDQEDFKYESIIEWNIAARLTETIEL